MLYCITHSQEKWTTQKYHVKMKAELNLHLKISVFCDLSSTPCLSVVMYIYGTTLYHVIWCGQMCCI